MVREETVLHEGDDRIPETKLLLDIRGRPARELRAVIDADRRQPEVAPDGRNLRQGRPPTAALVPHVALDEPAQVGVGLDRAMGFQHHGEGGWATVGALEAAPVLL